MLLKKFQQLFFDFYSHLGRANNSFIYCAEDELLCLRSIIIKLHSLEFYRTTISGHKMPMNMSFVDMLLIAELRLVDFIRIECFCNGVSPKAIYLMLFSRLFFS